MGGLLTYYAALRHADVFGKFGILSPSLWFNPKVIALHPPARSETTKIYCLGSRTEMRGMAPALESLYWKFQYAGYTEQQLRVVIRDRGRHGEAFWSREFTPMFEWLFERTV